jgi:hypothetical protein
MYFSRTLQPHERNYSTGDKEMLSIVTSLKHFTPWIYGCNIEIITDHLPNISFMSKEVSELNGRQMRWKEILNNFNIKFTYKEGKKLLLADLLSRPKINSITAFTNYDWESIQQNDKEIKSIHEKIESGISIKDLKLRDFFIDDNNVVRRRFNSSQFSSIGKVINQIVIPKSMASDIIKLAHKEYPYGHFGISSTNWKIKLLYYWPGMTQDIKKEIENCDECQRTKSLKILPGMMIPIQSTISKPFQLIGMDIAGPLPITSKGYQYFLVIIDYWTGWVEVARMKNITTDETIKKFKKYWINRFGIPQSIITDNGTNFVSKVAIDFYKSIGVDKKTTSVRHPQSDGKAEQVIGTIKNIIKRNILTYNNEWDEFLQTAAFAIRSCKKISSNRPNPSEALFGFSINTPVDIINQADHNENNNMIVKRKEIWEKIKRQTELYVNQYVEKYNRSRKEVKFQPGEKILLRDYAAKGLSPKFIGPFIVDKIKGKNAVTLKNIDGSLTKHRGTINIQDIKHYNKEEIINHSNDDQLIEHDIISYSENDNHIDNHIDNVYEEINDNDMLSIYNIDTEDEEEENEDDNEVNNFINNEFITDDFINNDLIHNEIIANNNINQANNNNNIVITEENQSLVNYNTWKKPEDLTKKNINDELVKHIPNCNLKQSFNDKLNLYEHHYKLHKESMRGSN